MDKFDLTGEWQFCEVGKEKFYKATVPGCIHLDLLRNNLIPDPFYRFNEEKLQWVLEKQWLYRKKFNLTKDFLNNRVAYLIFYGLDTFATIILNGQEIGKSEDMFLPWKEDVKKYLRPGENTLEVKFDSPLQRCEEREKQHIKLDAPFYASRVYARKAQYSFGWDWGPKLPTTGIWQPVELVAYKEIRIEDMCVRAEFQSANWRSENRNLVDVKLSIQVETDNLVAKEYTVKLLVTLNNITVVEKAEKHHFSIGKNNYTTEVILKDAKLWWPNGYGEQYLYDVTTTIESGTIVMDVIKRRIGIRKVEIEQTKDLEGKTFIIKINNVPIFCKGANWIPADSFVPRINNTTYQRLIESARDAHMNILRIWGGGIYENDIFYDLCDEKGIMVWHDFMFACGEYPEEEWFHENVKKEITYQIKRLRNHPAIVLWCGNNECEMYRWSDHWLKLRNGRYYGETLFYKIIPQLCQELDPTRPYWPSSPYGDEKEYNSQPTGDRHSWDVWGWWHDGKYYEQDKGRFISEFGYHSFPSMETIKKFTKPEDRKNPVNRVLEFHNRGGPEALSNVCKSIVISFPLPTTLKQFITVSQINQGEVLRYGIEHWRRRKFKTSGTIIWQLNDCWPVLSWSLIDYYINLKASYYIVKRSYAPVLLSFHQMNDEVSLWIVNDTLEKIDGLIRLTHMNFAGKILLMENITCVIPENSSTKIWSGRIVPEEPSQEFLAAELRVGNKILAENTFCFYRHKYLNLQEPKVKIKLRKKKIKHEHYSEFTAEIFSDKYAKFVHFSSKDSKLIFEDNYFDLLPKKKKTIKIVSPKKMTIAELKKKITLVNSLF